MYHEPSTKNSENLIKLEVYMNYETIEEPQIKWGSKKLCKH